MSESWIARAEALLKGLAPTEGEHVLHGERPPLLDAELTPALVSPLLAALAWSAAIFRELVGNSSLDPLALGLRVVALALSVRAAIYLYRLARRLRLYTSAAKYSLVIVRDGLLLRAPEVDRAIAREHVLGVVARGHWGERATGRGSPVFVALDPVATGGTTHLELPPLFGPSPGWLTEQLMRWRDAWPDREGEPPAPHEAASRVFDDAAAGRLVEGATAIRHGRGWLLRAPHFAALVGLCVLDGLARAGPEMLGEVGLPLIAPLGATVLLVPAFWIWTTRRAIAPRKGLSMVLTPSELLVRPGAGLLRTRWSELALVRVETRRRWSILEGSHRVSELKLRRKDGMPITFDEAFLGLPSEVAQILVDAYRKGRVPQPSIEREGLDRGLQASAEPGEPLAEGRLEGEGEQPAEPREG